jgi:hypothetical protein
VLLDERGELRLEFAFLSGELRDSLEHGFSDPNLSGVTQASELAGERGADPRSLKRRRPQLRLELWVDRQQMPAQPVSQANAL